LVHTTALCEAAALGHLEAARLLLDGGADSSRADGDGDTPLMAAALHGQLEVLRLLLGRGAAVDAAQPGDGFTAFHAACFSNQPACAEALARVGCDVGLKDKHGQTGRELAEGRGHAAVVERLRAVVAEQLRAAQAARPAPALESAAVQLESVAVQHSGSALRLHRLALELDGGPAVQLVTAAGEGDAAAVARLLAAVADPNASVPGRAPSGQAFQTTALREAAGNGRLEAARLLLEGGADPSRADGDGITPLMGAAVRGQLEVLRLLLGRGTAVDAVEPDGGGTAGLDEGLLSFCRPRFSFLWRIPIRGVHTSSSAE
jgi:ankyrin repeat protein